MCKNYGVAEVHTHLAVNHNQVEHFGSGIHLHSSKRDLTLQSLIRAEQKLLPCLSARVKRPGNLRTAERAIVQQPAVLSGERHALRHALVDDVDAHLRESVNVGFARPKVSAFYRIVEQAVHAVAIVVVILRGVDAALRSDGMRAPRRILEAKTIYVVAQFSEACRG